MGFGSRLPGFPLVEQTAESGVRWAGASTDNETGFVCRMFFEIPGGKPSRELSVEFKE